MTRTNVVLDDGLLEKCAKTTGIGTKRGIIDYALRELLRRENQKKVLELKGAVVWEGDLAQSRRARVRR